MLRYPTLRTGTVVPGTSIDNLWTEKYILSFENAVSIPPIYKEINELLLPFKERLEAGNKEDLNEEFYAALRHVLLNFEKGGEFADDFLRPKDVDLAVGMMGLFKKTVADRTITHDELIVLEYSGFQQLFSQEETKAWANGFFDITNLYIGKHNSNCVLCLFTNERHPVMVHVSHFEIFAEKTNTTSRYNNGQAFYQLTYYLQDAKVITDNHANNERAKIQAALMRIHASDNDNGDEDVEGGGYREARILYSPEGYFLTSKKYIICVSKNMGSGMKANILLGIAYFLGETPMKRILVNVYGMSAETPLYVKSFRCPGLLETESRPGRPCATDVVGLDEDNRPSFIYSVTTGGFFGEGCSKNTSHPRREIEILNKMKADGKALSALQEKRISSIDAIRIHNNMIRRNDYLQQQLQSWAGVNNNQSDQPREAYQYLYDFQRQHHQPDQQQHSGSYVLRHFKDLLHL